MLNKIIALLGIRVKEEEKQGHEDRMFDMAAYLQTDHSRKSIDEIHLAYRLLVKGELGIEPIRLFDPIEFGKVMTAYKAFRDRHLHNVIANAQLLALPAPAGPTEQEIDDIHRTEFELAYQQALDKKPVEDFANSIYDWLDSKGLIPYTDARKWDIFATAKAQIAAEVKKSERDTTKSSTERRRAKRISELFAEGDTQSVPTEDLRRRIIVRAKLLAFRQLVSELIEENVTITDFLGEIC